MNAIDISGRAPGGQRRPLGESLPLATPWLIQIFPVYACNLKCDYCIFSVDKSKHGFLSDKTLIDVELYKKCVDEMAGFPDKVRVVRFVGVGEPLLHKKLVEMVQYTAAKQVANTVEIITNGLLLTPSLSDALLSAGLNRLVVSIQGTSKEKYKEVSGTDVDFGKFLENLRYFYAHKGEAQIYIKIVDTALNGVQDEQRFREIFGALCDTIAIEHTVPIHDAVDYTKVLGSASGALTQFGLPVGEVKICPQPFFHMQINPDGKVVPCYSWEYPEIMGDCHSASILDIWNGQKFSNFRRRMLDGLAHASEACARCTIIKYRQFPEDDLADFAEGLKAHFQAGGPNGGG
ncbi:MAG TPA: radical SAM protein [Rhodospirillaceae bacterium]|nr:radical SAM protein [Rhodospirillaceae bacterium]